MIAYSSESARQRFSRGFSLEKTSFNHTADEVWQLPEIIV
jgi:hypothetical protein